MMWRGLLIAILVTTVSIIVTGYYPNFAEFIIILFLYELIRTVSDE